MSRGCCFASIPSLGDKSTWSGLSPEELTLLGMDPTRIVTHHINKHHDGKPNRMCGELQLAFVSMLMQKYSS